MSWFALADAAKRSAPDMNRTSPNSSARFLPVKHSRAFDQILF